MAREFSVEIWDEQGRRLLEALLAEHPQWEANLVRGKESAEPYMTVHPRILIPSEHPTITTPLIVELGGTLSLYWHRGYFFDFIGITKEPFEECLEFLSRFFSEQVLCAKCLNDDHVSSGGPCEGDEWKEWRTDYDKLELRSWRGTYDQDVEPQR